MRSSDLDPAISDAENGASLTERLDWPLVVFSLALAAGLALRFYDIGRESFWLDEAGRAAIGALSLRETPAAVAVLELSPPLYHFVLHAWMKLFGDGDIAIRVLSAVMVVPTVLLAWSVGDALGGRAVGAATAILSAVSPFAVHYGQEAAMYALLLVLSLGAIRAAMMVLEPTSHQALSLKELRQRRSLGLAAYVISGVLALYTHYYAVFLLATIAIVGAAYFMHTRSRHGLVLWAAAHLAIVVLFLPWARVMGRQSSLAASVPDWTGVNLVEAIVSWSRALLVDGDPDWPAVAAVGLLWIGAAIGLSRLSWRRPSVQLVAAVSIVPLLAAAGTSVITHSFRERGLMVEAGALWALLAVAVAGPTRWDRWELPIRGLAAAGLLVATAAGLGFLYESEKEDWRSASQMVQQMAGGADPIFFIHYGAQIPFDRYFDGPEPRVGLPESFSWRTGYTARFQVTTDDVERHVPAALSGKSQAWAVLSHEEGRGDQYLLAALDRWGARTIDIELKAVRIVGYHARPG